MKSLAMRSGAVFLFLFSFGCLLPHVAPHITAGDSAELALSGSTLGVAHSPGYPVFSLANKLGGEFLLLGNPAYRQNGMSAVFISLTFVNLGILLVIVTGQRWSLGLPALLLYSPQFYRQSFVTEVFPLTIFWASFMFLVLMRWHKSRPALILTAYILGFGLAVHQTLVLILPAFIFYHLKSRCRGWRGIIQDIPLSIIFFLLGASVYLTLPIRSFGEPVLDWEDPETLSRFWGVLTRARYGFLQLSQGEPLRSLHLEKVWDIVVYCKNVWVMNFGWIGLGLVVLGSLQCLARHLHRRFLGTVWLLILFSGPFFFWLSDVPFENPSDILARFTLLPLMGGFFLMGLALVPLWTSRILLYRCFMVILLLGFIVEGWGRFHSLLKKESIEDFRVAAKSMDPSLRWDLSLREAGLNMLRMIPSPSILLADRADETEFSLAYLLQAENRKKDVQFIDCNAGVTRSIYGSDYYRIWGRARLARRSEVESDLLINSKNPVFYATLEPTMIDIFRSPRGLLYKAWPLNQVREAFVFPWHKFTNWRFFPREARTLALYRTNLDLLGRSLFERGFKEGALESFGLAEMAGGANRYEMMGYWHHLRGEITNARQYYIKAMEAGTVSEALISNMGALEIELGRREEAISIYERGLEIFKHSLKLSQNLALAYYHNGQYALAGSMVNKVLSLDPKNKVALNLQSSIKKNESSSGF